MPLNSHNTLLVVLILFFSNNLWAANIHVAAPIQATFYAPFPERYAMERNNSTLPRPISFKEALHVRIEGEIEAGDDEKLRSILGNLDRFPQAVVSLNSPGGDFATALKMSDIILSAAVSTFVGPSDICLSSCGLIFLGGRVELIRSIYFRPSRFIHVNGRVGFHAPFLQDIPSFSGLPTADVIKYMTDFGFGEAREGIRELQLRIENWNVQPLFVFQFLGAEPGLYYDIDTYEKAQGNGIELLVDEVRFPKDIGFAEAVSTCVLVIATNLSGVNQAKHNVQVFVDFPQDLADREALTSVSLRTLTDTMAVRGRQTKFTLKGVVRGRGPFTCEVEPGADGRWSVRTQGDYPQIENGYGVQFRIDINGYVINNYTILGPTISWKRPAEVKSLFGLVYSPGRRAETSRILPSPSFSCESTLDPTAEVICAFQETREADATMSLLYSSQKGKSGVVERQREWVKARDRLCSVTKSSIENIQQKAVKAYCVYLLTTIRISELEAR